MITSDWDDRLSLNDSSIGLICSDDEMLVIRISSSFWKIRLTVCVSWWIKSGFYK